MAFRFPFDRRPAAAASAARHADAPWARSASEVLQALRVDPATGLSAEEAAARRLRHGANLLAARKRRRLPAIVVDQFRSVVILLLIVAGIVAAVLSDIVEAMAIFVVVLLNAGIGFATEWRATRSMEALGRMGRTETVVLRAAEPRRIAAVDLVPGDIVLLEGGDIVTADLRLIEVAALQADESTLTGESVPVGKQVAALPAGAPLMERRNMLFKGSAVTRGSGKAVVTGTGRDTELGRISELVTVSAPRRTPLEKRLDALAGRLVWLVIVIAAVIAALAIAAGRDSYLAFEVSIALAVAAIPEGLPIVATIALARGMWRMATRHALISRLSAVETLGAVSVIVTDKTGTLTENRMTVTTVQIADEPLQLDRAGTAGEDTALIDELLTISALCNNASLAANGGTGDPGVGDPTELALLAAASARGMDRPGLLERMPKVAEVPFDPDLKLMATLHRHGDEILYAVKGAPEAVVACCTRQRSGSGRAPLDERSRDLWLERAKALGARGLRTLAVASKRCDQGDEPPYRDLLLLGIVGIQDPAREGVREAIARCHGAGIAVVMVTGDHAATAGNIAREVGIVGEDAAPDVFVEGAALSERLMPGRALDLRVVARATPEQKLDLIDYCQRQGLVVAMTGDGVNDAPALRKADIGVAMGLRGTAVAREAAAMVLQDDEFGTIVEAVAQGRAIFENIRKFVVYLLSCNISELMIVSLATLAGAPLPLLPLQILFLNLVTDVFPALALGVGEGSTVLMKRTPRPASEPVLTRGHWLRIGIYGAWLSFAVLAAMALAIFWLEFDAGRAVTVSFCTLALAQLWHVFNMRTTVADVLDNEIVRNVWIWLALALCSGLVVAAVYTPLLGDLLALTPPGPHGWLLIVGMSLVPLAAPPVMASLHRHSRGHSTARS